ncbi:hypothetical protein CPB86DRAFT_62796 [Serendipita vermifera]|nr:hypothetical protein CPB86DRAFT_62796 [Serendipita vermifera]
MPRTKTKDNPSICTNTEGKVPCPLCKELFVERRGGLTRHFTACANKHAQALRQKELFNSIARDHQEYMAQLMEMRETIGVSGPLPYMSTEDLYPDMELYPEYETAETVEFDEDDEDFIGPKLPTAYIKTLYRSRTKLPATYIDLDAPQQLPPKPELPPMEDYAPFPSYQDFLFAEMMQKIGASDTTINFFLKNMQNRTFCEQGSSRLHLPNAQELRKCVDEAAKAFEGFVAKKFDISYVTVDKKTVNLQYTVWVKDGMQLLKELVQDPLLKDKWIWHAYKRVLHIKGQEDQEIIDHPMGACVMWNFERNLPPDTWQVQVPMVIYSDKSNAARFSQVSLWPVSLRFANLPKEMANKNSKYGGNTPIALLPKIQPPHGEKDNPRWPSFAREVFHRAMECVLEPFILPSKDGVAIHCGDGQTRSLVPWFQEVSCISTG